MDRAKASPNLEFYGFYLDKKLEAATEAMETSQ